MGTMKDRNGMDLTEAEDIKNRLQEYTKELYKIDLYDPDNPDGVTLPKAHLTSHSRMSGARSVITPS